MVLLVVFMILASVGIGLTGAAPPEVYRKKHRKQDHPIEMVDRKKDTDHGHFNHELEP